MLDLVSLVLLLGCTSQRIRCHLVYFLLTFLYFFPARSFCRPFAVETRLVYILVNLWANKAERLSWMPTHTGCAGAACAFPGPVTPNPCISVLTEAWHWTGLGGAVLRTEAFAVAPLYVASIFFVCHAHSFKRSTHLRFMMDWVFFTKQ